MSKLQIKHGFLYLADLNPRQGTEAGKLRPVMVIQTNFLNDTEHASTWILPCTTRLTDENILRVRLPKKMAGNTQDCDVMVDQSRTIDNQRFKKSLGFVPTPILKEIKRKLSLLGDL